MSNIALVVTSLKSGGLERNAALLSNHFNSIGHKVYIFCIYSTKCFFELNDGIEVVDCSTNKNKIQSISIWTKLLKRQFELLKISSVISFGERCGILVARATKNTQINHICRGVNTEKNLINKLLLSLFNKRIDCYVFQTNAQESIFPKKAINKGVVIPNPFDIGNKQLNHKGINSKRFVVVASFKLKQKRQDLIIEAFSKFYNSHPEFVLELYGSYDEGSLKTIESLIHKNNLESRVHICGEVKNPREHIVPSRAFLCASTSEGMPNALIESLSYGIPVISSNWLGYNEVLKDKVNSLIFEMNNVDELVKKMCEIADNDKLFQELSSNALSYNISKFTFDNVFSKWDEIVLK